MGDGSSDYLVTCSWNGDTTIMDLKGEFATFKLEDSVTAFCSGMYTVKSNIKPVPSFVFITMSQKVCEFF